MCGRFALHASPAWIAKRYFELEMPNDNELPRYNITPGTQIPMFTRPEKSVVFQSSHWGFLPAWVTDVKAPTPINAKAETVATSKYFRHAFSKHRGLVPADGYFEWRQTDEGKKPYYIRHKDGDLLFMAGIWEPAETGSTCAVITQPAAAPVEFIHNRMPMLLDPECRWGWLDPKVTELESIRGATKRLNPRALEAYPVSTRVNNPRNNDVEVLYALVGNNAVMQPVGTPYSPEG